MDIDNFVEEESTTTGTGDITLAAIDGAREFSQAFSTGGTDVFYYAIYHPNQPSEFEFGTGHLSDTTTLVRDTVLDSSNSDNLVDFSSGTKKVICDVPESDIIYDTVSVSEASFTDQQLGTGDSPTFNGLTANDQIKINTFNSTILDIESTDTSSFTTINYRSPDTTKGTIVDFLKADGAEGSRIAYNENNEELQINTRNSGGEIIVASGVAHTALTLTSNQNSDFDSNDILNSGKIQFSDTDGDGDQWELKENSSFGTFEIQNTDGSRPFLIANDTSEIVINNGITRYEEQTGDPTNGTDHAHIYAKNGTNGTEIFVQNESGNSHGITPNSNVTFGKVQFSDTNGNGGEWEINEENEGNLRIQENTANAYAEFQTFDSQKNTSIVLYGETGTAPSAKTLQAQLFAGTSSNSVSVELFAMDSDGNETQLSSHDSDGYYYVNHSSPDRGIRQEIDVEKAIKFIEEEFGKEFIREYELEA